MLAAIWGIQTYQNHIGGQCVDAEAQQTMSLVYLDRTMRVADELASWPDWATTLVGFGTRSEELEELRDGLQQLREERGNEDEVVSLDEGLENLGEEESMDDEGRQEMDSALAVLAAELGAELGEAAPEGLQAYPWVASLLADAPTVEAIEEVRSRVLGGDAAWWEVELARRVEASQRGEELDHALAGEAQKGRTLAWRSMVAAGFWWGLVVVGVCLAPRAWRQMRSGAVHWDRAVSRSYPWRWAFVLLLGVFVLSDLFSGFLVGAGYFLFGGEGGPGAFLFDTMMDLGWRFMAPALALLVLFRRPRHAVRTLRLNGAPAWSVVLAMFALLSVVNIGLALLLGGSEPLDPTGGLDAMEAGWPGLVYAILTACVAAPIVEEIMYRGVLLRGLERRLRFFTAAAVVAAVFALAHNYGVLGLVSVGIFGFSAAVVYRATNSLKAAILLHALYNLSVTLPMWWVYHAKI